MSESKMGELRSMCHAETPDYLAILAMLGSWGENQERASRYAMGIICDRGLLMQFVEAVSWKALLEDGVIASDRVNPHTLKVVSSNITSTLAAGIAEVEISVVGYLRA